MKVNTILLMILVLIVVPLVVAQPTYQKSTDIVLQIPCTNNGSTCSGTSTCEAMVINPIPTIIVNNESMTKNIGFFSYTVPSVNTSILGDYELTVCCKDGSQTKCKTLTFGVTGTGFEFSQAKSIIYIAFIGLLVGLFVLVVFAAFKLPTKDETDDFGMLLSVGKLKYLKPVLFGFAWGILLAIMFISSNIALAYFGTEMMGQLLFTLWRLMFIMTFPGILIFFLFLIVQIFRDNEIRKMIDRGIDIPGAKI